jgi:hypothetical protein
MTRASRAFITNAAEVLNRHISEGTPFGKELASGTEVARATASAINEILRKSAEGGTLVCATEIDGTLLGFVPRTDVLVSDLAPRSGAGSQARVPKGPDSGA